MLFDRVHSSVVNLGGGATSLAILFVFVPQSRFYFKNNNIQRVLILIIFERLPVIVYDNLLSIFLFA